VTEAMLLTEGLVISPLKDVTQTSNNTVYESPPPSTILFIFIRIPFPIISAYIIINGFISDYVESVTIYIDWNKLTRVNYIPI